MAKKYSSKREVSRIAYDSLGIIILISFAVIINEVAQKLGTVQGITGDTVVAIFLVSGIYYAFKKLGEYGKTWGR